MSKDRRNSFLTYMREEGWIILLMDIIGGIMLFYLPTIVTTIGTLLR